MLILKIIAMKLNISKGGDMTTCGYNFNMLDITEYHFHGGDF